MKTVAELKRNANTGTMKLELIEWYGKTNNDIPERLQGIRKVKKANSVAIILINNNGDNSELRLDCGAKLIDYDGEYLALYEAGEREVNEQEKNILAEAKKIYDKYADTYNGGYWQVKDFYRECDCPWMEGTEKINGKKYQTYNGKVRDNSIKGEAILKYRVYME